MTLPVRGHEQEDGRQLCILPLTDSSQDDREHLYGVSRPALACYPNPRNIQAICNEDLTRSIRLDKGSDSIQSSLRRYDVCFNDSETRGVRCSCSLLCGTSGLQNINDTL